MDVGQPWCEALVDALNLVRESDKTFSKPKSVILAQQVLASFITNWNREQGSLARFTPSGSNELERPRQRHSAANNKL